VILLVGVLLLIVVLPVKEDKKTCSNSQKKAKAKSVSESTYDDEEYEKLLEKKLEGILERMDGVGEVSVMITLSDDGTRIVDKDTKETSESIEKTTVIYDDEDASVPYVTSTDKPTVSGVLVVAQGGGNPQVNNDISNAVSALFDVPMHKIKIAKEVPFVYIEQTSFAIFRLFYYNSPAFQQSIFKSYSALLYFTPVISFLPLIANNSETPTT